MKQLGAVLFAMALAGTLSVTLSGPATGQAVGQAAGQGGPLDCRGSMVVPNEDGTTATYDMKMRFADGTYRIEALSRDSGEVTQDEGPCADVMQGCRHEFVDAEGKVENFYNFGLEAGEAGLYRYRETWADGATVDTVLECR